MRTMNKVANSRTRTSNIISPLTANFGSPMMKTSPSSDLLGTKEGEKGARAAINEGEVLASSLDEGMMSLYSLLSVDLVCTLHSKSCSDRFVIAINS